MFRRFLSLLAIIAVALAGPADNLTGVELRIAFEKAANLLWAKSGIELDHETKASLYGLYKRGSNDEPRSGANFLKVLAYNSVKRLTVEEAQKQYINKVAEISHDFSL
jgi:hypothetical protein